VAYIYLVRLLQVWAGPSRWSEKAVLASSSDEDDDEEVFPKDMSTIPKGRFH
jgi:hypothetical protein